MQTSIDWVSFTVPISFEDDDMLLDVWGRVATEMRDHFPLTTQMLFQQGDWSPVKARAPYKQAMQRDDNGVMIFSSLGLSNALIEISGIGCDALGSLKAELAVVDEVKSRITRIDIATDIETEVQPDVFAQIRQAGSFKAWSESVSSSGHTCYVGSKSSDRFARIYRYFPPHPRARFLRVEHVIRHEQAKLAADAISASGLEEYVSSIGKTFGWKHEVWQPSNPEAKEAHSWRPERGFGKTVMWVYSQVIPALLKLHRQGIINVEDMFNEDILPWLDIEAKRE